MHLYFVQIQYQVICQKLRFLFGFKFLDYMQHLRNKLLIVIKQLSFDHRSDMHNHHCLPFRSPLYYVNHMSVHGGLLELEIN